MTTIYHYDIRRRLLNMNTKDTLVIGVLTIRFFMSRRANRWQIEQPGLRTSFSYKVYPTADYIMGTIDQIGERNAALAKTTAYIVANYRGEGSTTLTPGREQVA